MLSGCGIFFIFLHLANLEDIWYFGNISHTHSLSLLLLCSVLTFRRMGKAKLQLSSWIPASLPLFHSHSSWYSTIQRERGQFYAKHARVTRSGVIFSQQMPPCWKNYHKDLNVAFPFKNILNILLIMGDTVLCSHNMWWMEFMGKIPLFMTWNIHIIKTVVWLQSWTCDIIPPYPLN